MPCAREPKASRFRLVVVSGVLRLRVPSGIVKVVFLCIHYVQILITQPTKRIPLTALSASRYGSSKVRFLVVWNRSVLTRKPLGRKVLSKGAILCCNQNAPNFAR